MRRVAVERCGSTGRFGSGLVACKGFERRAEEMKTGVLGIGRSSSLLRLGC